jgi:hypothetical protein
MADALLRLDRRIAIPLKIVPDDPKQGVCVGCVCFKMAGERHGCELVKTGDGSDCVLDNHHYVLA